MRGALAQAPVPQAAQLRIEFIIIKLEIFTVKKPHGAYVLECGVASSELVGRPPSYLSLLLPARCSFSFCVVF
jgi:hypothetical protein